MKSIFLDLFETLELTKTKIAPPPPRIVLCGGKCSNSEGEYVSLRQRIYHSEEIKDQKYYDHILLPENIFDYFRDSEYTDLLAFEKDLAALSALTVVIPEGPGSFAELGAFSVLEEINRKLVVIIHEDYNTTDNKSSIYNGPIKHLESLNDESIVTHSWLTNSDGTIGEFDELPDLLDCIGEIADRHEKEENLKLEATSHLMFIVLEILKIALLMTLKELMAFLEKIGFQVKKSELEMRLNLMILLDLVDIQQYQNRKYYILKQTNHRYARFITKKDIETIDPVRWADKFSIFYQKHDAYRMRAYKKYLKRTQGQADAI